MKKKREVILWGESVHLPQIIELMKDANVSIFCIVSNKNIEKLLKKESSKTGFYNLIKLLKKESSKTGFYNLISYFLKESSEEIPVICSFLDGSEKESFFKCMAFCKRNKLNFLHPACMLHELKDFPRTLKVKLMGLQGSGNILIQQFIGDHLPETSQSPQEIFYSYIASHYYEILRDAMEKALAPFGLFKQEASGLSHAFYGFSLLTTPEKKTKVIFSEHPLFSFAWDRLAASHSIPSIKSIEFFKKRNFKNILVLRHPLDIIRKYMSISDNNVRKLCKFRLQNMVKFYSFVLEHKDDLYVVKYEDVVATPIKTLGALSNYIGLKMTPRKIEKWWEAHKFKQLERAPSNHYQGNGIGAWKKLLTQKHFEILQDYGIIDMAHKLGYSAEKSDILHSESFDVQVLDIDKLDDTSKQMIAAYWSSEGCQYLTTPKGNKIYFYSADKNINPEKLLMSSTLFLDMVDSVFP